MPVIRITGWTKGCDTVNAIKEIREKASLPLNEAFTIVNRVLNNEEVEFFVSSSNVAEALTKTLGKMGLIATNANRERT